MKEKFIKDLQRFLNQGFRYKDWQLFFEKQQIFLLQENIINKTEKCEYNSLWDVLFVIDQHFALLNKDNLSIGTECNVTAIFNDNLKYRQVAISVKKLPFSSVGRAVDC